MMKKMAIIFLLLQIMWACDGGNTPSSENPLDDSPNPVASLSVDGSTALANGFCATQTRLQIVGSALLSAYSAKDNGSDLNYCGGENMLSGDKNNFAITVKDYCFVFRDRQLILNGDIAGATESGANFVSEITNLDIVGDSVDLTTRGKTTAGRADDMFISTLISDNSSGEDISLEDVSLKKGELDFGYLTLPDLGRFEFKFIEHFNAELTRGQLYIYGIGDQLLIITAADGAITAVYKASKLDTGTSLNTTCGV
jgi:hypothetical protein